MTASMLLYGQSKTMKTTFSTVYTAYTEHLSYTEYHNIENNTELEIIYSRYLSNNKVLSIITPYSAEHLLSYLKNRAGIRKRMKRVDNMRFPDSYVIDSIYKFRSMAIDSIASPNELKRRSMAIYSTTAPYVNTYINTILSMQPKTLFTITHSSLTMGTAYVKPYIYERPAYANQILYYVDTEMYSHDIYTLPNELIELLHSRGKDPNKIDALYEVIRARYLKPRESVVYIAKTHDITVDVEYEHIEYEEYRGQLKIDIYIPAKQYEQYRKANKELIEKYGSTSKTEKIETFILEIEKIQ